MGFLQLKIKLRMRQLRHVIQERERQRILRVVYLLSFLHLNALLFFTRHTPRLRICFQTGQSKPMRPR